MKLRALFTRIVGAVFATAVSATMLTTQAHQQPVNMVIDPPSTIPDTTANLIRVHGCWTLETGAPLDMAGKFPTHAIVDGHYVGKRLAGLAFDQEVGGHDHGLDVAAFCR